MNGTYNNTQPQIDLETRLQRIAKECYDNNGYEIALVTIISVCVCPAIFGNILIIVSYAKFHFFHNKSMYKYILNMAISDLLMDCAMFAYLAGILYPETERYKYFCILRFTVVCFSVASSTLFLTLISIDRFFAIVYPLRHRVRSKITRNIRFAIIVSWVLAFVMSLQSLFFNSLSRYDAYDADLRCSNSGVYPIEMLAVVDFIIVAALIGDSIVYAIVVRTLVKRPVSASNRVIDAVSKTKLMIIVHVTFAICWMPFVITNIVFNQARDKVGRQLICTREYLVLLGVVQSCTNCVYYGLWNSSFRKAFKNLLCCCCKNPNGTVVLDTIS